MSPTAGVRILAVSGSLRAASTNTAALRTAAATAPPGTTVEVYAGLGALPGSFKNLLDWCIGDGDPRSIYEKPVAWINTSPRGATAAHESLAAVLGYAHATVIGDACIHIPVTAAMAGADGTIADPAARAAVADAVAALSAGAGG